MVERLIGPNFGHEAGAAVRMTAGTAIGSGSRLGSGRLAPPLARAGAETGPPRCFSPVAPLATARLRRHNPGVPKTYSREEADEILRRALARESPDGINHEDLVAAAREVGIPESAIEAAAGQVGEHQVVMQRVARLRRQKRRAFVRHLITFLIVNGGVFLFDYFDGGPWFFQYLLILWGILLLLLGIRQLAPEEAGLVRKAERELEKERRRAERERRRLGRASGHPGGVPAAAKEFEHAVQEGANALLSAAARAIRDFTPAGKQRFRADDAEDDERQESGDERSARRRHRRA